MKNREGEFGRLKYDEVLERIRPHESHLLVGNGFNRGLGVNTSYPSIFQKMIEKDFGLYEEAAKLVEACNYDLEQFIGRLTDDIDPKNAFLKKFVSNKIKLDFMRATQEIVKSAIKNVYAKESEGIYVLLNSFKNYFTLNYDPFLYLLLLNFKPSPSEETRSIAFQPTLKFIEDDLNRRESNIFQEIKHARDNGTLTISGLDGDNSTESSFRLMKKTHFTTVIKEYATRTNKNWTNEDIKKVVSLLWAEEKQNRILDTIDDGSRMLSPSAGDAEYVFDSTIATQNLFFLHGAFHIYRDGSLMKKITQQSDRALYDRLAEILNSEEHEIVCVFQNDDKKSAIHRNRYLSRCLDRLNTLSGVMVIIGCSLADNDNHIFEQIENSSIETLYISAMDHEMDDMGEKALAKFPTKSVNLFDARTISYELPTTQE